MRTLVWIGLLTATAAPLLAQGPKAPRQERNRVSREELLEATEKYPTLYEAIRNLRPHFLTPKMVGNTASRTTGLGPGSGSPTDQNDRPEYGVSGSQMAQPVVYVDGSKAGDTSLLKNYSTSLVEDVRLMSQNESLTAFGVGYQAGVIAVKLRVADRKP